MPAAYFSGGEAFLRLLVRLTNHLQSRGINEGLATEVDLVIDKARVVRADAIYMDAAAMVFLLLSVVFYARATSWNRFADIAGFAVCATFFAACKFQHCALAFPIAALAVVTLPRAHRLWVPALILAGADIVLTTGQGSWIRVYHALLAEARRSPTFAARVRASAARVNALQHTLS